MESFLFPLCKIKSMKNLVLIVLAFGVLGCSGSKIAADSNTELNQWIESGTYEIESQWASPMPTSAFMAVANSNILGPGNNANRINLIGNLNHLRVYNDSIDVHLPFFGERFMGGGYNQNGSGIEFKAPIKNYTVSAEKGYYRVKFSAADRTGSYNIVLNLYPNKTANIAVNSSQRAAIQYQGRIEAYDPDKTEGEK